MDLKVFDLAYEEMTSGLDNGRTTELGSQSGLATTSHSLSGRPPAGSMSRANEKDLKLLCKISSLLHSKENGKITKMMDALLADEDREENETESSGFGSLDSRSTSVDLESCVDDDGLPIDVMLTDQERETFLSEGLPLPSEGPFTKTEERALKRIRRKIKNKLSAQESRRKKKEYIDDIEKKLESCTTENDSLREQVHSLNNTVRSLLLEVQRLQKESRKDQAANKPLTVSRGIQTGTCLQCAMKGSRHLTR